MLILVNVYAAYAFASIADKKCPFTGDVSIRGRILTGRVVSTKMTRTLIIRRDYLHYIPKYSQYNLSCPTWIYIERNGFDRPLREAAQKLGGARFASLPCRGW